MAKRDPNITAKNKWISDIRYEMDALLEKVLSETGISHLHSLNAIIGSKHDQFFNLKNDIFTSPDIFIAQWLKELERRSTDDYPNCKAISSHINTSKAFLEYLLLFLKRSFLMHFHEWSRVRPTVSDSIMWIGQNNANYGLLVTPRFVDGQWENDKSEIRSAKFQYWTIGHILKTGLVVPNKDRTFPFKTAEEYLTFFEDVIVRNSSSPYEKTIAECYRAFVLSNTNQNDVPLLIPEFRYNGLDKHHTYRLDFTIINPYSQQKIGVELSPWSTHGYIAKTKTMTQKQINEAAQNNFENEMKKHRDYFKKFNIVVLIYTDTSLKDCTSLFNTEIVPYLTPKKPQPDFPIAMARKYGL